jgi:2,3-bisphosphoglycerate-independent phosphoglycerate mutase
MNSEVLTRSLSRSAKTRILLVVADGLGGLPRAPGGLTELEAATTPNLDELARDGVVGLSTPVAPGITPGSTAGHLALFGYDPLEYQVGRGVVDALGVGLDLRPNDVAIRGNFCTLDAHGRVTDRRARRIRSTESEKLVARLSAGLRIDGVDLSIALVRDHRVVFRLRGPGLAAAVSDSDPGETGVPLREPRALTEDSRKTARIALAIDQGARAILAGDQRANGIILRGFGSRPKLPSMREGYGLSAAAVAAYPSYRGLARLVGMSVLDGGETLAEHACAIRREWDRNDFFFVHFKDPDACGEDGDFDGKVRALEALDASLPALLASSPDVVIVTGDHSTPSTLGSHSFHPVPVLLWAPRTVRPDSATSFGERACLGGGLGPILARELMPLALAHAGRLRRFGA